MIGHQSQCNGGWEGNFGREGPGKQIKHRQGEHSKNQRNDPEIPFGFWEGVKNVGEDEKEWGVKVGWILLVISELIYKAVPRFIERVDFVDPERFFVEVVESEGEPDEETKNQNDNFFLF
jgi:hypothetical protein